MDGLDLARLLARKAEQDEYVIARLADDPSAPDEVLGFHAQQAAEKLLKAVLASCAIRYRRTHDLVELIDLLRDSGVEFPDALERVRHLNPFATDFRYDLLSEGDEARFDRDWLRSCLADLRSWCLAQISPSRPDSTTEPDGQ